MVGGIIGVGFLSLPYITLKVGTIAMLFYFIILTSLVLFIHLIFGKISLATPDFKRWPGFVGYYLGKNAEKVIFVTMTVGSCGVLLAYLIIGPQFLYAALNPFFGGSPSTYLIIYFSLATLFIFLGIKMISRFDFFALAFLFLVLLLLFVKGFPNITFDNIFTGDFNTAHFFLPYGAILFALWGTGFIPEIEEMVRGHKSSLRKIIASSIIIAAGFYLLFIFLILGISGNRTTDSALVGLKDFLGPQIYAAALLIGAVTTFIAFISNGLLLKKAFIYDMKIKEFPAWVLACFAPLLLYVMGLNSFIPLISFVGGVFLGIDGILILLIYQKIGGKKIIVYPLILVFILGIMYSIMYSFS